jgi:hypothetical protein
MGAVVVVLLGACAFLTRQLLNAKDDRIKDVTAFSDRLIAQSDQTQALVKEHNKYYDALALETRENTKAVRNTAKTVEAHAFSCASMDKAKFVAIKSGQGDI